jgi:hypothetical protein
MAIDEPTYGPTNWRIRPPRAAAVEIRQLALREGRSLANMLTRLVLEALEARQRSDTEIARTVARVLEQDQRVSA